MRWVIVYFSTAVVMLPLDFAFLGTIGKKMFDQNVGDMVTSTPRVAPAVIFYLVFLIGVVTLVNGAAPGDWRHNLVYGGVLGLVAYSTFELTNMSILRHWDWNIVASDIAWGTVMTAAAAAGGGLLANWISARIST